MENGNRSFYTVSTEISFSASHSLENYPGDCARLHGHNWVVRLYYRFEEVDPDGLTVDFLTLQSEMKKVILPRFDHCHLNDVEPFGRINPTSENLAREIFRICSEKLRFEGGKLVEVELWETPTDMVRYGEHG